MNKNDTCSQRTPMFAKCLMVDIEAPDHAVVWAKSLYMQET